jgi:hypothetical protein
MQLLCIRTNEEYKFKKDMFELLYTEKNGIILQQTSCLQKSLDTQSTRKYNLHNLELQLMASTIVNVV